MSSNEITIGSSFLIIEDHPLFCEALTLALRYAYPTSKTIVSANASYGISVITGGFKPDIILLDLHLPDARDLDALIRIRDVAPKIPIIVISSDDHQRVIAGALSAGAAGFISKNTQRDALLQAVQQVQQGKTYTPPGYTSLAETSPDDVKAHMRLRSLTPQQRRILNLICDGLSNKQIGCQLNIAEATVKAHVTAVLRKLSVHTRVQAGLLTQKLTHNKRLPVANE